MTLRLPGWSSMMRMVGGDECMWGGWPGQDEPASKVYQDKMTDKNIKQVEFAPTGSQYSVLLVDDDANRLQTLANSLRSTGVKLLFATDAPMALEAARLARPELVLLNTDAAALDGTDRDGHETLQRLCEPSNGTAIAVMVICPAGDLEARATAFAMGAVDVIASPFSGDELRARVENQRRLQWPHAPHPPPRRTVAEGAGSSKAGVSPGAATDDRDLPAMVNQLEGLLRSGNTRAVNTLRVLMGRLGEQPGEQPPAAWRVLAEQVEGYDFKRALVTLEGLSLT